MRRIAIFAVTIAVIVAVLYPRSATYFVSEEIFHAIESAQGQLVIRLRSKEKDWAVGIQDGQMEELSDSDQLAFKDLPVAPQEALGLERALHKTDYKLGRLAVSSPDHQFTAVTFLHTDPNYAKAAHFAIIGNDQDKVLYLDPPGEQGFVDAFTWSPDSNILVVLRHRNQRSVSFFTVLSALSGHPWSPKEYYVEFHSLNGDEPTTFTIARNIEAAAAEMFWVEDD